MSEASEAPAPKRKHWLWALRIAGTIAGFAYVGYIVDLAELEGALRRVSAWAFFAALALTLVNLFVGAARWRILLAAYGAPKKPPILYLARAYLIGFFYNNYLPGGIGGDVVRGVVTRESFGERGATASVTVVLVERVLGLSGLLLLVSATYLVRPLPGTEGVLPFSALLLAIAAASVAAIAAGRRVAPHLPDRLATIAASLPAIERFGPFLLALAISLVTQTLVAMTGYVWLAAVTGGRVGPFDALVVVPLAMATAYFPFSVGGAGAREAAFVAICATALSMNEADALAASLLMWITQLAGGALGGIVQLAWPIGKEP